MSTEKLIYQEVKLLTKSKMIELLKNKDIEKEDIIDIILCISMNNICFKFAEKVCRKFIKSEDLDIKGLVIVAIGHIARVYGKLVHKKILDEVINAHENKKSTLWDRAEDTFDDIQIFLGIDFFKYRLVERTQNKK